MQPEGQEQEFELPEDLNLDGGEAGEEAEEQVRRGGQARALPWGLQAGLRSLGPHAVASGAGGITPGGMLTISGVESTRGRAQPGPHAAAALLPRPVAEAVNAHRPCQVQQASCSHASVAGCMRPPTAAR